MSDVVYQALIAAIVTIVLAVINLRAAKKVAQKAEEVKTTLVQTTARTDGKLDDLTDVARDTQETGEKVHVLVNSSMSAQLKISMIALKRVAELTKHPDDLAAAELATKLYHEHEGKQKLVDKHEATRSRIPPVGG